MSSKKKLSINMIASMIVFAFNLGINFLLSPYIIKNIGTEAYGFVSLANNFVNYATIITIALNSMACRFITISIHRKDEYSANKYFNSVLLANLIIVLVLIIPSLITIIFLDSFLDISNYLIVDVKLLFLFIFINFFITIVDSVYNIATFVTNNLYISSINSVKTILIKVGMIIFLFVVFYPHVFYVGIATLISSIFLLIIDIYYTKKLLPDIEINKKYFSKKSIIVLIKSGIWNTVTKLGQLLSDGLDLLVCNLLIDAVSMGRLAIAKTISSVCGNLIGTVSSTFTPELTILYAKNKISELVQNTKTAMKITGFFANVPLAFIFVFGVAFYNLWTPTENAQLLSILTILSVMGNFVAGAIHPLYSIYTITNKIKVDAICRVVLGFINVGLVFMIIKFTNLGIYAVAGTSIIVGTIFNFIFVPTYSAYCLKVKKTTFYPVILRYMFTTSVLIVIISFISKLFVVKSWLELILVAIATGIVGMVVNYILLLNKNERVYLNEIIKKKFLRKRRYCYEK